MKFNKIMLMGIFLLTVLTISSVNATDNVSESDIVSTTDISESDSVSATDIQDNTKSSEISDVVSSTNTNEKSYSSNTDNKKTSTEPSIKTDGNTENVYKSTTIYISDEILTPILSNNEINYVCYVKDDKLNFFDGDITVTFYNTTYLALINKKFNIPITYTWNFDETEKISGFWILNNDKIILRKTISNTDEKKGLNIVNSTHNSDLYNKLFYGEDKTNTILYIISNSKFTINTIPVTYDVNGTPSVDLTNDYAHVTKIKVEYLKKGETKSTSLTKKVKVTHDIVPLNSKYLAVPKKTTIKLTLKKVKIKKSAKKIVLTATLKKGKKVLKSKKVTFKFNGKKYVRKTNKKGIAKLTIKKSTLKKLKVGKNIKYQVSYGGKTRTITVKVKK